MSAKTAIPMGRLTRKIQCQSRTSVRIPPRSTPILPPPAATKPKTPIALARSLGSVKSITISDRATAETTAPPRPCTARATTRASCEVARPQPSEASVKSAIPIRNRRWWPKRSPSRPPSRRKPAEGQQVGVHDPGERGLGEAEVLADRRQRHSDDRHVEDDHQVAQAQHDECQPAVASLDVQRSLSSMSLRPERRRKLIARAPCPARRGGIRCRSRAATGRRGRPGTRPAR